MKNKIILICAFYSFFGLCVNAQPQQKAEQLALHIAQKIKDTLNLHDSIKTKLYNINMQIHYNKMQARMQFINQLDSITFKVQRIERTRDSLYQIIIPPSLFSIYKQKKRNLVSPN
jgi:hypothetical protein